MSVKEKVTATIDRVRARWSFVDHLIRMQQHYGEVKGNLQAGAVTYFGFLSFFPILALAFAVVGLASHAFPQAQGTLIKAIDNVLPGMVGNGKGQISLDSIQSAAPGIFSIGVVVVLYSGLGWLSAMRNALLVVFEKPPKEQPNFLVGKLLDLVAMVMLGIVLMVSVAVSGVVTSLSADILGWVHLGDQLQPLLVVIAVVVGLAANALLFYAFFRLLGDPDEPRRALWSGALLGSVGFEVLKQLSQFLLKSTAHKPAFQAFGIALILLVWIYYFSRVVMYAASWAHTDPRVREERATAPVAGPEATSDGDRPAGQAGAPAPTRERSGAGGRAALGFLAGALTGSGATMVLRRNRREDRASS